MTRRSAQYGDPRSYLLDPSEWPEGDLTADAPPAAVHLQQIVRAVEAALAEASISRRELARRSGLGNATLDRLLNGVGWPDYLTIVAIEDAVGVAIWPDRTI
ncbi:MAG: helix-turn-helix transcriptional regulator [Acidimicrobiales bacterium]